MIIYLTYNDQPSGVYWSQVTDVVEHLNTLGAEQVRLVALVSTRGFVDTRRRIKARSPSAWVIPMVPRMARWRKNTAILAWVCRILRPKGIIARGVMATWMALRIRDRKLVKRVCFDGRGAYAAEWEEYRIIDDDALIAQFRPLEHEAVNASDQRIAVSNALVAHWRERYGYDATQHVVLPCALGKDFAQHPSLAASSWRLEAGIPREAVVLVYSGSTAGWQSFQLFAQLFSSAMRADPKVHVLFLSKPAEAIDELTARFPGRVFRRWLNAEEVQAVLGACDYGVLVREDTLTNRVASPTKFAEYLAGGLRIIISPNIGDFSELTTSDDLGIVVAPEGAWLVLERRTQEERGRLRHYAQSHFTKGAFNTEYRALLQRLAS